MFATSPLNVGFPYTYRLVQTCNISLIELSLQRHFIDAIGFSTVAMETIHIWPENIAVPLGGTSYTHPM